MALASSGPLYYSGSYFSATLFSSSTADQECGRRLFPPHEPVPAMSFSVARFQTCSALVSAPGWKRNGVLKTSPTPVKDRRSEGKKEGDRIFQQVWPGGVPFTSVTSTDPPVWRPQRMNGTTSGPTAEAVPVHQAQAGPPRLSSDLPHCSRILGLCGLL